MEYLPDSLLSVFRQCRKDPQRMSPLLRKIYIFQMFKAFAYLHVPTSFTSETQNLPPRSQTSQHISQPTDLLAEDLRFWVGESHRPERK